MAFDAARSTLHAPFDHLWLFVSAFCAVPVQQTCIFDVLCGGPYQRYQLASNGLNQCW